VVATEILAVGHHPGNLQEELVGIGSYLGEGDLREEGMEDRRVVERGVRGKVVRRDRLGTVAWAFLVLQVLDMLVYAKK
jgi:hypothetical protein